MGSRIMNTMRVLAAFCAIVSGSFVLGVTLALLLASLASAHDWYPYSCCSGKDCGPIDKKRVALESNGYRIDHRFFVPYGRAGVSVDVQFHACFAPTTGALRCFFAPTGAI